MGTRADFWIGTGPSAEWVGSVGWDGSTWADVLEECREWEGAAKDPILLADSPEAFRKAVAALSEDDDFGFTHPERGWPWPWSNSSGTDYAYVWTPNGIEVYQFGTPTEGWPDMTDRQNVALDGRSGLLFVVPKKR